MSCQGDLPETRNSPGAHPTDERTIQIHLHAKENRRGSSMRPRVPHLPFLLQNIDSQDPMPVWRRFVLWPFRRFRLVQETHQRVMNHSKWIHQ